ncbi:MAG TPA: DUF4038 domain-containing protein [Opitutus sp.]|nr:DUF4038 domain-containing protein [Opitutus sp.]
MALALALLMAPLALRAAETVAFPLKLSTNHRYFVDRNDRPFRLNCESAWMLSVQATQAEVNEYLDDRAAKGFNSFILMAMVHPGDYTEFAPQAPRNRFGRAPHERVGDFSSAPDEDYWKFIDWIIDAAAKRHMAVVFAYTYLGYGGGNQGWWQDLQRDCNTEDVCFKWGAWLGRRYRDRPNILWYTIGDFTPPAGSKGARRTRRILDGIKAECPWALFGGEPSGCDQLTTDASDVADAVQMNSFYGYGPDCDQRVYLTADRAWNHEPAMPAWVGEPVYYDEQIVGFDTASGNRQDTRALQWQSVLAGGTAGDNTSTKKIWKWTTWRDDLNNGYAQDRSHLFAFFGAMPWQDLVPSGIEKPNFGRPIIMKHNPLDRRHIVAAATEDRTWLVVYTPPSPWVPTSTRFFTVDFTLMVGPVRARWFNPATGGYTLAAASLPNTEPHRFVTPGDNGTGTNDWVLVCDPVAKE